MACDSRSRPRRTDEQGPYNGNHGPTYGDMRTDNYKTGRGGYGPAYGHDNERTLQTYETPYDRDEYADYDPNPWSPQEQNNSGYAGSEPSQRGWQDGRSYGEPSHSKPTLASHRNGTDHRDRRPRPPPGLHAQGQNHGRRYDNHNSWRNYDQTHQQWRDEPQSQYHESEDNQHNGSVFEAQHSAAPISNQRSPRNDLNLDYRSKDDHLPRYLNHGDGQDRSESRWGTNEAAQHHRDDLSRSPKPPPSSHSRTVDSRGASSSPSRPVRILEDLKSPEKLSWDNPFPTFPPKPKKSNQGDSNNMDNYTARTSLDDLQHQSKNQSSRPQTASSKTSHGSSHNNKAPINHAESSRHLHSAPRTSEDLVRSHNYRLDAHDDGNARSFPDPYSAYALAYDRPVPKDKVHGNGRMDQTNRPAFPAHYSANTQPQAKAHSNGVPAPACQRSRTMPAALSNVVPDSGLIPTTEPSWPEPGAVSGYYGPQDKGYLPNGSASGSQSKPPGPSRILSEEGQWGRRVAAGPMQDSQAPQPRIHKECRENFFNGHQEAQGVHLPYQNVSDRFGRTVSNDEEMPNFEASRNLRQYDQESSIDSHLHTGATSPRPHPMSAYSDPYTQHNFNLNTSVGRQLPQSRSQPDLNEHGPRQQQEDNGFNFGLAEAAERRPATSASTDAHGDFSTCSSNGPSQYPPHSPDPNSRSRSNQNRTGPIPGQSYSGDERYKGSGPRYKASRPPHPNDPRSRPMRNGGHPDNRPRQPGGTPTPLNTRSPTSTPYKPLPNPNALPHHPSPNSLPHHPAPPRQGSEPRSNQAQHPPPVRQYNSTPTDPVQQSTSSRSGDESHAGSVTPRELESLRQKTVRTPNDSPSQFQLAKKLVEASEVLVDQRADPATRKRTHDKYQADALKIVRKLSALSYSEADFYYADCYSRGALGLPNDIKEAFILYQKAAKANHAQAAYRVAVCCELGQEEGGGTKHDPIKAMQWYKRAATLGDVAAMYKMGVIQLKGLLGQPRDLREAMSWLSKAADRADKENPHALHELALLHEKPMAIDGVQQDEAASRRYFTQAANLGYKFSQFRLGCAYEYGLLGCTVDPRQSIAWYSKAAVQEEHQSELALSGWYLTGTEGVLQQSDTEAYLWARKAAQAGLAKAEYAMGYFTEVGIGAPANLEDAKRWYWKSASQHFPKARDRLEDLRRGGGARQKARVSRSNMKKQSDGECVVM